MTTIATGPPSVFPRLGPLLARVSKPIQYVGGELNSLTKDWESVEVRWCLSYPDAYEVGLPNQGIAILYEVLNEQDWILAERTYAVWGDMEALMRDQGVPQFTLDSHRPVGEFDVFGLSFATELGYTNMLTELDLAGNPDPRCRSRGPRPYRPGWRTRGIQPRTNRRLPRCCSTGRRRADRTDDLPSHP
jgi:hypothetical protein